jgi:uroporphyrinogen-III synthase
VQGALPERVTLYLTSGPTLEDGARLLRLMESEARPDVIAFFSPSSVIYFVRTLAEMASGLLRNLPALACIGETTAKAVEETLHRRAEIIARKANQASLASDILTYLKIGTPPIKT